MKEATGQVLSILLSRTAWFVIGWAASIWYQRKSWRYRLLYLAPSPPKEEVTFGPVNVDTVPSPPTSEEQYPAPAEARVEVTEEAEISMFRRLGGPKMKQGNK